MSPIRWLKAEILGRPRAWPRTARVVDDTGKVRGVNPAPYRTWKGEAADKLAAFASYRTFTGEVAVSIYVEADRLDVKVVSLDPGDPRRKPTGLTGDLDNYGKAVLDALQASGVLTDDVQVSELFIGFRP